MQRVVDFAKGKALAQEDLHRVQKGEALYDHRPGSSTVETEEAPETNTLKRYKGLREQKLGFRENTHLSVDARRRETTRAVK